MKKDNVDIETIIKYTNLTKEEIEKLKAKNMKIDEISEITGLTKEEIEKL